MAAIGEIRKRSWLLVVVIVIGMLAFILGDMLTGRGGAIEQKTIATINGKEITSLDYQQMVDKEFDKSERAYQALYKQSAPASMKQQLNENYMSQYLNQQMFEGEYNKIGLEVTKDEFNDLIQGNSIDGKIYEQFGLFVGADRKFNPDTLKKYMPVYSQDLGFQYILNDIVGEQAEKTKLQKKYFEMIRKGLYTTSFEAKKDFLANSSNVNFEYVAVPFSSVPDDEVSITEADFKAYYQKHKNEKKYDQVDKVSFEYVQFPIEPSVEDLHIASNYLESRVKLFKDSEDDSAFVRQNSDSKNLDFSVATFPKEIDSSVQKAQIGDVIGPYRDGEFFKISKVIDNSFKEEAEVRHILIGNDVHPNPIAQKKLADSITKIVKADKSKFAEMVTLFSTDRASIPNGGKYEWFDDKAMVPEFTKVSFKNAINSVSQAKTQYGIHIIEVLGRRNSKQLKVATVDSEIRRSKETINNIRENALEFVSDFKENNVSDTAFRNGAAKLNLAVLPAEAISITQKEFAEFGTGFSQIKKWAFSSYTDEGDISDDMVFEKNVTIARLKNRTEAGIPSYEDLSEDLKSEILLAVLNEKKAEYLKNKLKGATLIDIAAGSGVDVKTAENVTLNSSNIQGAGNEPAVIGAAFGIATNTVSKPIVGNNGVYVINVKAVNEVTLPENFDQQKEAGKTQLRGNVQNRVYQALIEATKLEDNREKVNILGN